MASRMFCDLCDTLLKEDDQYFRITGDRTSSDGGRGSGYRRDEIMVSADYVSPVFAHLMVCTLCYVKVLKLLQELIASRV